MKLFFPKTKFIMTSFNSLPENTIEYSYIYFVCSKTMELIKNGQEEQAKRIFPMEYHFINKYLLKNMDELVSVLSRKLELH